jgi:tetratricopeptide (TPR) repeat protein
MFTKDRVCAAAVSLTLVISAPTSAAAQKLAFVDAFVAFHSALFGTYGDEGRDVTAALERMSASLDVWELSRREAEAELRARPTPAPSDRALFYADARQFDAAIAAMRDAVDAGASVAAEPSRAPLHLYLGGLYEAAGQRAEAGAAFRAARALDPSDPVAAYLIGLHRSETAAAHEAVADDAVADDSDTQEALQPLLATLMRAYDGPGLASKRPLPQFALIDDLSAPTRVFAPAAYASGFALAVEGRFHEAIDVFRVSVAKDPLVTDPAGRSPNFLSGIAALRQRRGQPATEALEAVVREYPSSAEAHRVLGIVYRAAGRLPESIARFEEAVRLAPDDERARVALGSALIEAGRLEDAERALREAIARLPASGEARWALADVYERQDRGNEAIRVLEESASLIVVAGKVHLYWRIAEIAHALHRDHRRAIDVLTRRMRLVPNEPHAHKDLGLAYARAGRDDEALLELLMTRLLGYEDAETLTAIGQIHLNQNRLERAEATLVRAVALDPKFAHAHYALGRTLQRLGRAAEAGEQMNAFDRLRAAAFEEQRLKYEREAGAAAASVPPN